MHASKKVRVAWMVMMIVMKNTFMAGMELFKDGFRDLSYNCNIVDLSKLLVGWLFSSV